MKEMQAKAKAEKEERRKQVRGWLVAHDRALLRSGEV